MLAGHYAYIPSFKLCNDDPGERVVSLLRSVKVNYFFNVYFSFQYLKIIPEYFVERKIIIAEIANGYINCIPYICSALLTETPRAVIQTIALNGMTISMIMFRRW